MEETRVKITKIIHYPERILTRKLRDITMLKNSLVHIYENVFISLEKLSVDCLVPPQNYVLSCELLKKRELKYALEEHGYDLFNIGGYLEFCLEGDATPITLLPPIVEESIEADGTVMPIINDGMHRAYLARIERRRLEVVFIRGIPKQYPYYAYPVRGEWDKVEIMNNLPTGYIKKWHRIEDNKKLYRNFDSVFTNCSKPRVA